jgi:Ubiquitin-binding domain
VLPGNLINGAYDDLGNHYELPEYCVSTPTNILHAPDPDEGLEGKGQDTDDEEAELRRAEKGKMPLDPNEKTFNVRARLSDRGDPDIVVQFTKNENVRVIARRIAEMAGVSVAS